jgi:hypothetical protein
MNRPQDPIKAWLSEFLFLREHFSGSTGQPLFQYQVTSDEYATLRGVLVAHHDLQNHFLFGKSWASAFCLYVAERFRREYDGREEGWSWIPLERVLDCTFSLQRRATLVEDGLAFWKRPVRQRDDRRHLLGSLFLEGGLPWPLVQSGHGFGRSVRRGLKYFYRTESGRLTTADLIAASEDELPKAFQNLDTRHLLAGVVDQLMALTQKHPLMGVEDPAAYLDERDKKWRESFPIPLDESNARSLINDWLRDADTSHRERDEALARERTFSCMHRLIGTPGGGRILTEVTLPIEQRIPINLNTLRGTRLTVAFYEGEKLLRQARAVYAQREADKLVVPYSIATVAIERRDLSEPLTMRLLESGRVIHIESLEGSQLEGDDVPLIFENRAEQWWMVASASCQLTASLVQVRLPPGADIRSGAPQELGTDAGGGRWVETSEDLVVGKGPEIFRIQLHRADKSTNQLVLKGDVCLYESTPGTVFLGRPLLEVPSDADYQRSQLIETENGRHSSVADHGTRAGTVRYAVRTRDGETLLLRRFGLLPKGFRVQLYPAMGDQPARIVLRNAKQLECRVLGRGVKATPQHTEDAIQISLECRLGEPPARLDLELSTQGEKDPVTLHFDYPLVGAQLRDSENRISEARELTLDELLGTRITLSSSQSGGQDFYLIFKLQGARQINIQRHYRLRVTEQPVPVRLFGYLPDIRQMLGSVPEQYASVRLLIETDREWRRLDIGRYNGRLVSDVSGRYAARDWSGMKLLHDASVEAMSVGDPGRPAVALLEHQSEGVGTGEFIVPHELNSDGPWILYAAKQSKVRFEPCLYKSAADSLIATGEVMSLHEATRQFHPDHKPFVIDHAIEVMADDLYHSGWQYLDDLRKNFRHLPLSTFQAWLSLSRNLKALAVAVLRLEFDEETCGRVREDLAVIWETIPLDLWIVAFDSYRSWRGSDGLPEQGLASLVENRKRVLRGIAPGLEFLDDYVATGDRNKIPRIPPIQHLLGPSYCTLRRNHSDDDRWPTDLSQELSEWVSRQVDLPPALRNLANADYARAVTYLPMFMAYVTLGRANLSDLAVQSTYVKFAIRKLSDYDRRDWYQPAHAAVLVHLLGSSNT